MPPMEMPGILPLPDGEVDAILSAVTPNKHTEETTTAEDIELVAERLHQFVTTISRGIGDLINTPQSGSVPVDEAANGIWVDRASTRLRLNGHNWRYAAVDMSLVNSGPIINIDPPPVPHEQTYLPEHARHDPRIWKIYLDINLRVQVIQELLLRHNYVQWDRGRWLAVGSIVVTPDANRISKPKLAASFRDSLVSISMNSNEEYLARIEGLFKSYRVTKKEGSPYAMFESAGRIGAMNYIAERSNGMISYLPIKPGVDIDENTVWSRSSRQEMKPGRFLRSFFGDDVLAQVGIEEKHIEQWANAFVGQHAPPKNIEIVRGSRIKTAYLGSRYSKTQTIGDLKNSCMRYDHCQEYLNIYADNPAQIGLAIVKDEHERYVARSLVWTDVNGKLWFDRVYGSEAMQRRVAKWLADQGYDNARVSHARIEIKLDQPWFRHYPYMDTMHSIYDDGTLSNSQSLMGHGQYLATLRSTGGSPNLQRVTCRDCGQQVRASTVGNDGLCKTCRDREFNALCDRLESPDDTTVELTMEMMQRFCAARSYNAHSPDNRQHQVVTITKNNHHWLYVPAKSGVPAMYRRMTQEVYDDMARAERERLAELERLRLIKEADKVRVLDELSRGHFPGVFNITEYMATRQWGWENARLGVAWLRCTDDVRMLVDVVITKNPAPSELGYTFSLNGYTQRSTTDRDVWETLPFTANPLEPDGSERE